MRFHLFLVLISEKTQLSREIRNLLKTLFLDFGRFSPPFTMVDI